MTNETQNYIAQWENTATQALAVNAKASASKDEKAKVFNALAWLSLNILIANKIQDRVSLAKAVSKEGKFFSLRQCVSNAKPLATQALEQGFITVPEGRGKKKTEKQFTVAEVTASDKPLFTVSSAYRNTLKNAESVETDETFTDDMAMALYAEAEGLDVKTIKEMGLTQEAITQGHILHGAAIKAQALAELPNLYNDIEAKFSVIVAADMEMAKSLVSSLQVFIETQESVNTHGIENHNELSQVA